MKLCMNGQTIVRLGVPKLHTRTKALDRQTKAHDPIELFLPIFPLGNPSVYVFWCRKKMAIDSFVARKL